MLQRQNVSATKRLATKSYERQNIDTKYLMISIKNSVSNKTKKKH